MNIDHDERRILIPKYSTCLYYYALRLSYQHITHEEYNYCYYYYTLISHY